jgi:DNA primase
MPFYPQEQIDLINSYSDIVEVISQYLPLKRSGRNFKALCPFHSEKTPSFTVSPDKQIFHCFGCGAGGNVFSFIMRRENMTFPEAVRYLARRANVELPEVDSRAASKKEHLLKLHQLAAGFFHWGLTESRVGAKARAYLDNRGIKDPAIKSYNLGYAQPGWDSFLKYAGKKGYKPAMLLEAGLILERSKSDGYYDRFRDRLVIPVCDSGGRVIAFGARVFDDSKPKYVNSPDTPLFRKGNVLFGIHQAREAIRECGEVILGEGYFDVIKAHQEGLKNIICSQGTAFTEIQAQVLKRYTDKVIVAFDADQAGTAAALRGLTVFLQKDFEVRMVLMPADQDPDSYIRSSGVEAFKELVADSQPLIDFKLDRLCRVHDIKTDRGRLTVVREMLDTITQIESAVLKETYTNKLALRLGVSPAAVWEEYRKRKTPRSYPPTIHPKTNIKVNKYESRLLKYLLENDRVLSLIKDELDPEAFSPPLQPIVGMMLNLIGRGESSVSRSLMTALRDKESQEIVSRLLLEQYTDEIQLSEAAEIIIDIQKKRIRAKKDRCWKLVAGKDVAEDETAALLRESMALSGELKILPDRIRQKMGL